MGNTISVIDSLRFGWDTFKKDPWFYVWVTFVLLIVSTVISALTGGRGGGGAGLLGFLVSFAASTVITIAYAKMALAAAAGMKTTWQELWAPEHFLNMLGAAIIQAIIVMAGFVLLIVPGIIAALILSMTQLSVVDKKMNPIEAVKNSYYITKGHLVELLLLVLALMVLNIIGLVLLVVGLLVTVPVTLITMAHVYRTLSSTQEPVVVVMNDAAPQ